jgi:hypothetical protein
MLVKYDHFSDLCPSWVPNPLPEEEQKGTDPILPLRNKKMKPVFSVLPLAENLENYMRRFIGRIPHRSLFCD